MRLAASGDNVMPQALPFSLEGTTIAFNNLYKILCHGDGSCFFHAICTAIIYDYVFWDVQRQKKYVRELRENLAEHLPKVYNTLSSGTLGQLSEHITECRLDSLVKELKSNHAVGELYIEYLSNEINRNILLIDTHHRDLYLLGSERSVLIKDRMYIILLYTPGHYDLLGIKDGEAIMVQFPSTHPFIQILMKRWDNLVNIC